MMSLPELCALLERAQASQNIAIARALAVHDPATGATARELPGAIEVFFGEGHPLNQGLALGLGGALDDATLDDLETSLGRGGHPVVVELTPGADADLGRRLARRGYYIRQFQSVWMRELDRLAEPAPRGPFVVRAAARGEATLFARLVMAGFTDQDALPPDGAPLFLPPVEAAGTTAFIAWHGTDPVAGGTMGLAGDVAALSGAAVLPAFRGRGLQRALIEARLAAAREGGARLAVSATVPASASAENLVRAGFRPAYPKVEMANRDAS